MDEGNRQSSGGGLVKLNVGGRVYVTLASTLTQNGTGDNFFSRMLSGKFSSTMVDSDQHFIDRNGDYFAPLLDYLRTGHWHVPQYIDLRMILREADFYGIELGVEVLSDDAIPVLREMTASWDGVDPKEERAVLQIKEGLLRQLHQQRPLKMYVLEDKEAVQRLVGEWWPAVSEYLGEQLGDLLFDSDLYSYLSRRINHSSKRVRLTDSLTVDISLTEPLTYNSESKDWSWGCYVEDEYDRGYYWTGGPKVVVVSWSAP
jgi:hypothetical protein